MPLIFSIPRRRRLEVYRQFFIADLSGVKSYLAAPLGALGAALIVILDTMIWLSTCFAFAAPMILSGLYEAVLDKRMLDFLNVKVEVSITNSWERKCAKYLQNNRLTLDMRARCLMVILIGNLDLALDPDDERQRHMSVQAEAVVRVIEGQPVHPLRSLSSDTAIAPLDGSTQLHDIPLIDITAASQPDDDIDDKIHSIEPRADVSRAMSTAISVQESSNVPVSPPLSPGSKSGIPHQGSTGRDVGQPRIIPGGVGPGRRRSSIQSKIYRRPTVQQAASPWRHMEKLLYDIRLYDDKDVNRNEFPRQHARHKCLDANW